MKPSHGPHPPRIMARLNRAVHEDAMLLVGSIAFFLAAIVVYALVRTLGIVG